MTPGERLRAYRKAMKLTAEELGRRAAMVLGRDRSLSAPTIRSHENGTNGISADLAEAYARVLRVKPSDIMFGEASASGVAPPDNVRMVGIIGDINAGAFAQLPDQEPEPSEFVPVSLPEYRRASLFALNVIGRSMDRHYADGSVVVVCPAAEAGIRDGDHVVVRRWSGGLAETTLKESTVMDGRVVLLPRSTDPEHQAAIPLAGDRDSDEGPEIIGVVVGSFQARAARSGPLMRL